MQNGIKIKRTRQKETKTEKRNNISKIANYNKEKQLSVAGDNVTNENKHKMLISIIVVIVFLLLACGKWHCCL